ncbi:hypothetical protein HDU98_011672 [Podochytrium sp. JEL0797]|nr:hypothetical protein HDU98_011672 [Podochytrium sp. JEL0797]
MSAALLGPSKPIVTYFGLPNIGRGEVTFLFLHEAQIPFVDNRIPLSEWPAKKAELMASGGLNAYGGIPVVELASGKVLTQHVPTLRYIARKIGKYGGSNDDEVYALDQITDVYIDWRYSWVTTVGTAPEFKAAHLEKHPRFYGAVEALLVKNSPAGPFVLGEQVSYAEPCLYQLVHDDGLLEDKEYALKYPRLFKLVAAFGARPQVAKYLEERKKLAA